MSPSNPMTVPTIVTGDGASPEAVGQVAQQDGQVARSTQASSSHPLKVNVGKSFRGVKGSESYLRENEYKVIEFVPVFDFGSGGKKPAYRFERVGVGSVTVQACAEFLKNFEAWPETADSTEGNEAPKV